MFKHQFQQPQYGTWRRDIISFFPIANFRVLPCHLSDYVFAVFKLWCCGAAKRCWIIRSTFFEFICCLLYELWLTCGLTCSLPHFWNVNASPQWTVICFVTMHSDMFRHNAQWYVSSQCVVVCFVMMHSDMFLHNAQLFFFRWNISIVFAVTFWSLKHFGHQLAAVLKLTTTVFFAYIFEHSDRHYYFFCGHFENVSVYNRKKPDAQWYASSQWTVIWFFTLHKGTFRHNAQWCLSSQYASSIWKSPTSFASEARTFKLFI